MSESSESSKSKVVEDIKEAVKRTVEHENVSLFCKATVRSVILAKNGQQYGLDSYVVVFQIEDDLDLVLPFQTNDSGAYSIKVRNSIENKESPNLDYALNQLSIESLLEILAAIENLPTRLLEMTCRYMLSKPTKRV